MSNIVIIIGPTAIGKSSIAVELAKKIDGEIISADSMQIYKGMDIGTGKIVNNEMQGIKHHLIDVLYPVDSFSVEQYVKLAKEKLLEIQFKKKTPIIVGGTGLYINALINGHNFADTKPNEFFREKCNNLINQYGNEFLYDSLKEVDPLSAEKISVNDTKRIIRALEIFELTGKPKSTIVNYANPNFKYNLFILTSEREIIYNNINNRVDKMFANGLIKEVESLIQFKDLQSMKAIGYKEVVKYLLNELSLDETISLVKQNSRRYAKRQLTYFRWFNAEKKWLTDDYLKNILKFLYSNGALN